jgi:hypothetical protein
MSIVKKLSMATTGAAFIALGTFGTAPATAALIDFSFTTSSGGTGSFTLDTDTPPGSEPAILEPDIPEAVGILYPKAVSNYSFSSSYLTFNNVTADWIVAPSITSDFIGLPPNVRGVLSGPTYPSGCTTTPPNFTCLFDVAVIYSVNRTDLPVLDDNPLSYSRVLGIDFYNPTTGELRLREDITSFQVVPEPDSALSLLGFGIGGYGLLLKRKMNRKKAAIKP